MFYTWISTPMATDKIPPSIAQLEALNAHNLNSIIN